MRFGTFLLQKELISKESFILAMTEQLKNTPPLLHFINQYCSTEQTIKALDLQESTSKTLGQIQREHQIFDELTFQKALDAQKMSKRPLGQILLDLGAVKVTDLDEALKAFQNQKSQSVEVKNEKNEEESSTHKKDNSQVNQDSDETDGEEEISPAALESLKELVEMGSFDPEEYERLAAKATKKKN